MAEVTPITLLIGLRGAGKTTLLYHLMDQPEMVGTAVVAAQPDPPMWWGGGCCACCAPRDDVARALRAMLPRVRRDEVERLVIETAGLADPGPILATLLSDTVAASAYRLDGIITVVDAVDGMATLDTQDKAMLQIAAADRIVLTKTDLADTRDLRARLVRLNPGAPIIEARHGVTDPAAILHAGPFDPGAQAWAMRAWANPPAFAAENDADHPPALNPDDARIEAFCLTFDRPLPRAPVTTWLERLILKHGDAVLRMKGILHLRTQDQPVAIHSVRHLLFPPLTLTAWPSGEPRNSRLMFITRDLPRAAVEAEMRETAHPDTASD